MDKPSIINKDKYLASFFWHVYYHVVLYHVHNVALFRYLAYI